MFNCYNYPQPVQTKSWKSAHEIEINALKQEERRLQMQCEGDISWIDGAGPGRQDRSAGFLSFLKAPIRVLTTLIG